MAEESKTPLKDRIDKLEGLVRRQADINLKLIEHLTEVKDRLLLLEADAEEAKPKSGLILPERMNS